MGSHWGLPRPKEKHSENILKIGLKRFCAKSNRLRPGITCCLLALIGFPAPHQLRPMVDNIVSLRCHSSVVSGIGIVGLIQCCYLLLMDRVGCIVLALFVPCTLPLLWPPPQIGTLRHVWHHCHRHFMQYGATVTVLVLHGSVRGLLLVLLGEWRRPSAGQAPPSMSP